MKTDELREKYLSFFESKGHTRQPSDVLAPSWDPSVLFTPAGMNQFKNHFLGKVKLDFTRATTCQKCLRTGDIDNVGRTAYHHTFFEMMGNFSFGDYFKRDAIRWAWEFLTDKKWLGIDPQRLSVTVYVDDNEAADIWDKDIGLPSNKIERMGENDNFWPAGAPSQGPDGVCGPCSEIFFQDDFGDTVEIWNLVFTQFDRVGGPPDNLRPLPSKNIDTGMGLERTAAVLQGVQTNFHIDLLIPIVEAVAEVCQTPYRFETEEGRRLRRITDHVRACVMAVHENVYPGAQKEKYVIRRLLRRAVLDGHQLGMRDPFLYRLAPAVVDAMKIAYPELTETSRRVSDVIKKEEESFFATIDAGLARIEGIFDAMKTSGRGAIDGAEAADLYQTYGVPPELFEAMAAENNLAFDWDGFCRAMSEHGEASGKVTHTVMGGSGPIDAIKRVLHETKFLGYETTTADAQLKFIVAQNQLCDHVKEVGHDRSVLIVLDRSPFYGESGGQVGDRGTIVGDRFKFQVNDTRKDGGMILHHGHLIEGEMKTGVSVAATVEAPRRQAIRRAHSATHILHYALQQTLGSHAQQQGSKVDDDEFRFDFTNMAPVSGEQLTDIEKQIGQRIAAAEQIGVAVLPLAEARAAGAMMLFGEKYPDPVRMVSMGDFSKELCGGTHLENTGQVSAFEIVSEEGVSAGTRRIVALTGEKATVHSQRTRSALEEVAKKLGVETLAVPHGVKQLTLQVRNLKKQLASGAKTAAKPELNPPASPSASQPDYSQIKAALRSAAHTLNVSPFDLPVRVASLLSEVEGLKRQLNTLVDSFDLTADALLVQAEDVAGVKVVVAEAKGANANLMRQLIDQMRKKAAPVAALLASSLADNKVTLVAGVSRDLVDRGVSAGDWVKEVAPVVGGGGGGKADMAQAGGKQPENLPQALEQARSTIRKALS